MNEAQSMMNCSLNDNLSFTYTDNKLVSNSTSGSATSDLVYHPPTNSCWDYWQNYHYPQIIQSYPVYIQEKAKDKGKEAFEIIKMLKDKRFINLEKVADFIDVMDELIKIL